MIAGSDISGIILAGGQASRMNGLDKGLQQYKGTTLVANAIARLQPQVASISISANRNLDAYKAFGFPVRTDDAWMAANAFQGPLAGFLTGLEHCQTRYLMTAPCDTPLFPLDMVQRLATELAQNDANIAMACSPDETGKLCNQPVFCLLKCGMNGELADSLRQFLAKGGRKIGAWTALHKQVKVPFNLPHDEPLAFANLNTLSDLQMMHHTPTSHA
ncbi:MAG TPA: molybdenum cofactor guanylyltransferase MobA [Burkholderiaceae bacterium]|nr:molybdenum cofactor guanylyltransferase MobA [Burkholderiaceae bacterium]